MWSLASIILLSASLLKVSSQTVPTYGQCGGIGWSGGTVCASGSCCTVSNAYYSQCLPGSNCGSGTSPTTTSPSTSRSVSTSKPVSSTTSSAPSGSTSMATTTHYVDGQQGACGCGTSGGEFSWVQPNGIQSGWYTAAVSQALFGSGLSCCGSGCGKCYALTSTGSSPPGQGTGGGAGQTINVMATNLCPYNGNQVWCPNPGQTNQYGYSYHFDIDYGVPGWNNPIVSFQEIPCPGAAVSAYDQCLCVTSPSTWLGASGTGCNCASCQ